MRVLYWTESFWPRIGGSEVAAGVLLGALSRRGHQFEVVTRQWSPEDPAADVWQGIPVHRIPYDDDVFARRDPHEYIPLRQRVLGIKRRFKPDLVHVGLTGPSLFLHNFTATQSPAPAIVTLHVMPVESELEKDKPVLQTLRAAACVAPVSHATAAGIQHRVPELAGRCVVIHNALPKDPSPATPVVSSPPKLLCVGRVTAQKGFDTAVAAMPRVLEVFPDAQLSIAGDGDAADALRQQVAQLGLSKHIRLLGWTPPGEITSLIDAATLVLMPSRWEPFGLVALQAAQRGRGCLASNLDGLPEVVRDESTGLLLPCDDPDQWAAAIVALLGNPRRLDAMGRAAEAFADQQFSVDRHVDAYESLYCKVVASARVKEAIA